ncbi:uncharacterized protein LOC132281018 [Cornus florida]|uniref:uncharacterized protein LOC132281018 n=1 Tax=Cornus florida TaxID=4283 RepID=UPI002899B37C|nr:uncharacterized protein LOC132281018 [Cornus florida]
MGRDLERVGLLVSDPIVLERDGDQGLSPSMVVSRLRSGDLVVREEVNNVVYFVFLPQQLVSNLIDYAEQLQQLPSAVNKLHLIKKLFNMKMVEGGVSTSGSVLNVESRGKGSNKKKGNGNRNRGRSKLRNGRTQSQNFRNSTYLSDVECWNFGNKGHYRVDCKLSKKGTERKTEANDVSEESDDALICSLESKVELWVLDSSASFDGTSSKELFNSYEPGNLGKVYLGIDQPCNVIGKGEM